MNAIMCHSTIKMKPIDIKSSTYIDFRAEHHDENPKFNVGDHMKTFLQKVMHQIGLRGFCD